MQIYQVLSFSHRSILCISLSSGFTLPHKCLDVSFFIVGIFLESNNFLNFDKNTVNPVVLPLIY